MLDRITPVILTCNEEANIERVLDRLHWAESIVVVDSFSTDRSLNILAGYRNVHIVQHPFENHAAQWNFAVHETAIATDWILALDADYVLSTDLIAELSAQEPDEAVSGYRASFRYCVFGRPLRGALYPPVTVLFKREQAHYVQDGHTQRVVIKGKTEQLQHPVYHDDRKPLSAWLIAQDRYMTLEADTIHAADWRSLGWADRVRKLRLIAPVVIFIYCLFGKQGILDGWYGVYYACQRTLAEMVLSLKLIQLKKSPEKQDNR